MSTCRHCGQPVLTGFVSVGAGTDGTPPRKHPILLDPGRQCFAPWYDQDVESDADVQLTWSNARAEHVCPKPVEPKPSAPKPKKGKG